MGQNTVWYEGGDGGWEGKCGRVKGSRVGSNKIKSLLGNYGAVVITHSLVTMGASHEKGHEVLSRLVGGSLRSLSVHVVRKHMGGKLAPLMRSQPKMVTLWLGTWSLL